MSCAVVACAAEDDHSPAAEYLVESDRCASGLEWTGGDHQGSEFMNPGGDCIGCHTEEGAPDLVVAGTVYQSSDEADGCAGAPGVSVTVEAYDGETFELMTNEAGNFFLPAGDAGAIAYPLSAQIEQEGQTARMTTLISVGGCNTCHTAGGASGAPGRIVLSK